MPSILSCEFKLDCMTAPRTLKRSEALFLLDWNVLIISTWSEYNKLWTRFREIVSDQVQAWIKCDLRTSHKAALYVHMLAPQHLYINVYKMYKQVFVYKVITASSFLGNRVARCLQCSSWLKLGPST